jgi:hypothetical protein
VLHSRFRGELFDRCAKHPVEGWERMNDVGERLQRRATKNTRAKRSRLSDVGIGYLGRGFAPRTPYTLTRGGPVPRSVRVARSLRSLALD